MERENYPPIIEFLPAAMAIYMVIMMPGMLLVYQDFYFNILETKFIYYAVCTITMVMTVLGYLLLKGDEGGRFRPFSAVDGAVMLWGIIIVLSTLLSPEKKNAMWGLKGRYTGCFLLLLYVAAYFCITRYYRVKEWHMAVFLAAGAFVCLFGITDFFDLDLLNFKEEIKETQRYMFCSTIGNINTYTSCVAMIMAFAGVMFGVSENKKKAAAYGICTMLAFVALILGESDNAYLSLAAFFGLLPFYFFQTRRGIKRYLVLVAGFFMAAKGAAVVQTAMEGKVVPIKGLFQIIAGYDHLTAVVVGLWCLAAASYVVDHFKGGNDRPASPWFVRGWAVLAAAVIALTVFVLYDVNEASNADRYGRAADYLLFNDSWGTNRGYIWRIAVENYRKLPLLQKIFGYGPDTFGIITITNNYPEMVELYGQLFDNAHNEYLQYLVTIGPLGLASYVAVHVGAAVHVIRQKVKNPLKIAALFSVLCYASQAFVNINQPIATPIMWTFLAITMSRDAAEGEVFQHPLKEYELAQEEI